MKRPITVFALSSCLFFSVTRGAQAQASPPKAVSDSVAMQGSWTMLCGAADGAPLPPSYVSQMKRVVEGAEVTVTMGGTLCFKARIELHSAARP